MDEKSDRELLEEIHKSLSGVLEVLNRALQNQMVRKFLGIS